MRMDIAILIMGISSLAWSDFTLKGGIIKDLNTKLEWQNNFINKVPELSWNKAVDYCENLSLNGDNWRLPNKEELISIIKKEKTGLSLDTIFLNKSVTAFTYWTSSKAEDNGRFSWGVSFGDGWVGRYNQRYSLKVRCVRGELAPALGMAKISHSTPESEPFEEEKATRLAIFGKDSIIFTKK